MCIRDRANFSWQTTCDNLINQFGENADVIPYDFVFKVQDNFCQVPKITYATVRINVMNPGVIQAPEISCIQTDVNVNRTLFLEPVSDPTGSFEGYSIYSIQNDFIDVLTDVNANNYTVNTSAFIQDYYLTVSSGCDLSLIHISEPTRPY